MGCSIATKLPEVPEWVKAARSHWQWRGNSRPARAEKPGPGQVSVWDFPRPPVIVPDTREIVIQWLGVEIARTTRALSVLETSHPPTFYLPMDDIAQKFLVAGAGNSFCEWKGPAQYWSLAKGDEKLINVAWSYPKPLAGAEALIDRIAFYPHHLICTVDSAPVTPQPSGFYGGWITPELVGPFKGERGSEGW